MKSSNTQLVYWDLTTSYRARVTRLQKRPDGLIVVDFDRLRLGLKGARIRVPNNLEVWLVLQMQSHRTQVASEFLVTAREGSKGLDEAYISMVEKGWEGLGHADIDLLKAPWYSGENSRKILDRSRFDWHFPLTNGFYDPPPREHPHPFTPK